MAERLDAARSEGELPGLVELPLDHLDARFVEEDVVATKPDRLANPHPAHRKETDQGLVGVHEERGPKPRAAAMIASISSSR